MPQNNKEITESPEFKNFIKEHNLEVLNIESVQIALFASSYADRHLLERIEKLELVFNERRDAIQEANESSFKD